MKNIVNKQHGSPSNSPTDGDAFTKMLEVMTVEELTDGLNEALESITEENYDPALIDAYLAALDQKAPMPETPNAKAAYTNFQERVLQVFPLRRDKATISSRKFRHIGRVGLVAILTIICLLSSMIVAQAAGVNVFGAIARWTDEVFSLGTISSPGAKDETINTPSSESIANDACSEIEYSSLQEALDEYGIEEFSEPTWVPTGYALENIEIDCWPDDGSFISLYAKYVSGSSYLNIRVECYQGDPNQQLQKTDAPVETFVAGGFEVYLFENINNNCAAWVTEHYECYIVGPIEKQTLKQIVLSAYASIQ